MQEGCLRHLCTFLSFTWDLVMGFYRVGPVWCFREDMAYAFSLRHYDPNKLASNTQSLHSFRVVPMILTFDRFPNDLIFGIPLSRGTIHLTPEQALYL